MNEIDFKQWLNKKKYSIKVQSDIISRIKRIEQIDGIYDLNKAFENDMYNSLLLLFKNKGNNENMSVLKNVYLPIEKYQLSTYKYAVNLYVKFKIETMLSQILV